MVPSPVGDVNALTHSKYIDAQIKHFFSACKAPWHVSPIAIEIGSLYRFEKILVMTSPYACMAIHTSVLTSIQTD